MMPDEINRLYDFSSPATFDERFVLPVDVDSSNYRMQALANSSNTLAGGVALPVEGSTSTGSTTLDNLMGLGGRERVQLWPEKMVRGGLNAPQDAMAGRTSEELIPGAMDMAGLAGGGLVAGGKSSLGVLGGKLVQPVTDSISPRFFSQVENVVKNAKMEKGSSEQWLGYIRNQPGVRGEELEWVMKDLPKGQLTKEQVAQHVADNKVEVGEVVKGGNGRDENGYLGTGGDTKYANYQLPGGKNYREVLMTLPSKAKNSYKEMRSSFVDKYGENFLQKLTPNEETAWRNVNNNLKIDTYKSPHWDEPNPVAHIRMNDRTIDGKKSLHLEEIQSDWHQAGREKGYRLNKQQEDELLRINQKIILSNDEKLLSNPDIDQVFKEAVDRKLITSNEAAKYKEYSKGEDSNIPDAPFKKTWTELALKRAISEAAEKGYDRLSWTPGEAQAARYDLSKQIDKLYYNPEKQKLTAYDKNDNLVLNKENITKEKLNNEVGKEISEKILNNPTRKEKNYKSDKSEDHVLEGQDLKIGGEGMKGYYDQIVPKTIEKLTGEKVKQSNIQANPEMKIKESGVSKVGSPIYSVYDKDGLLKTDFRTKGEAEIYIKMHVEKGKHPVHYIDIPQSLRDKAAKGFPLFSSSPVLVPVDHDPWKHKLTPINYNPFENPNAT